MIAARPTFSVIAKPENVRLVVITATDVGAA
jgi:hypothetical protein